MAESIWQILGIPVTRDEPVIQQAYAQKAKLCHPEDAPERWAILHDAYLQALRFARGDPARGIEVREENVFPFPHPESGTESEFSEEFREALSQSRDAPERISSALEALRGCRPPISSPQLYSLIGMLYELRCQSEAERNAAEDVLAFFYENSFTREANTLILSTLLCAFAGVFFVDLGEEGTADA